MSCCVFADVILLVPVVYRLDDPLNPAEEPNPGAKVANRGLFHVTQKG